MRANTSISAVRQSSQLLFGRRETPRSVRALADFDRRLAVTAVVGEQRATEPRGTAVSQAAKLLCVVGIVARRGSRCQDCDKPSGDGGCLGGPEIRARDPGHPERCVCAELNQGRGKRRRE